MKTPLEKAKDFLKANNAPLVMSAGVVAEYLEQYTSQMPSNEVQESIYFITENPDQNVYIADNLEHFMTGDEPDDNSIKLYSDWCEQYTIIVDWLKQSQPKEGI